MAETPPFPTEKVRVALQAVLEWILWKPPGEAVSGTFELKDFQQPKEDE